MRMQRSLLVLVLGGLVLVPGAPADETKARVTIDAGPDAIEFRVGKALVSRYHIAPSVAKPYFWPLNAPGGLAVTRGWPMEKNEPGTQMDHPHQKSAWFCHGDVIPEGIELKDRIKGVAGVRTDRLLVILVHRCSSSLFRMQPFSCTARGPSAPANRRREDRTRGRESFWAERLTQFGR